MTPQFSSRVCNLQKKCFKPLIFLKEITGLSLYKSKCEGIWLGTLKQRILKLIGILWPKKKKFMHWEYLPQKHGNRLNFVKKVRYCEALKAWSGRNLKLIGKICILQVFGISLEAYYIRVYHRYS